MSTELTPEELEVLERDGIYVSNQVFRQCYEPYMPEETTARFITSDSLLNGFHVLLEGTVKCLEERNAGRLAQALLSSWAALDGNRLARILLGVALRLLGHEVALGPVRDEVEQEVERVCSASECLLPEWLRPAGPDRIGLDYRRFRVRGFYTGSPQLGRYFRAFAWLKSIPLNVVIVGARPVASARADPRQLNGRHPVEIERDCGVEAVEATPNGVTLQAGGKTQAGARPGNLSMADFDGAAFHRAQLITREHVQAVLRRISRV